MTLFGFLKSSKKANDYDASHRSTLYRRSVLHSPPPPYALDANRPFAPRVVEVQQQQPSQQSTTGYTAREHPGQQYFDPRSTFWEPGSIIPCPRYDPEDILIAVMGMTGAGKTSFISTVAGVDMKIGHGLFACTKKIGIATMKYHGQRIHLIDTPGFDDTNLDDVEILETIAQYLTGSSDRRVRLSGVIYLHRITDPRVGGTALKNIRMFRGLVGNRSMKNAALVTTMWGNVKRQDGEMRMNQLRETDEFWGQMIESGATCDKYDNTRQDGLRILKMLIQKSPCTLQIQLEMEGGVKLANTTAGREVNERIEELKAEHQKDMAKLRKEMQQVQEERDEARFEMIKREYEAAVNKVAEANEAQARLLQATIDEQQSQIRALQTKKDGIVCIVM